MIVAILIFILASLGWGHEARHAIMMENAQMPMNFAQQFSQGSEYEILRLHESRYICHMPSHNDTMSEIAIEDDLSDRELINNAITVLGQVFSTNLCIYSQYSITNYWTFGYCLGDKVSQFHQSLETLATTGKFVVEDPANVYVLGRFADVKKSNVILENQSTWKESRLNASDFILTDSFDIPFQGGIPGSTRGTKFLMHTLTDGEICDLTREPRLVEIIYRCGPAEIPDMTLPTIVDVHEIKTCQYQMTINVPQLCKFKELNGNYYEGEQNIIHCKSIDEHTVAGQNEPIDFYNFSAVIPLEHAPFPVPSNHKISIGDFHISRLDGDFYSGLYKEPPNTLHLYYNLRTILIYTGLGKDLYNELYSVFYHAIDSKFKLPQPAGQPELVQWTDSFTAWFELYDVNGNFMQLIMVERHSLEDKILHLHLINPDTMVDQNGYPIDPPQWDPQKNAWNFEKFDRPLP